MNDICEVINKIQRRALDNTKTMEMLTLFEVRILYLEFAGNGGSGGSGEGWNNGGSGWNNGWNNNGGSWGNGGSVGYTGDAGHGHDG